MQCWFEKVLYWFEKNSTFVNIIFELICLLGAWLLYYFKFYRTKKSAALFDFYIRFNMLLSLLKQQIDCLNQKYNANANYANTNPYVLLYRDEVLDHLSLSYPYGSNDAAIAHFLPVCQEIKALILGTENNVYPKMREKDSWYHSQTIIIDFVLMITDNLGVGMIDSSQLAEGNTAKNKKKPHEKKWIALQESVNVLLSLLKEVKY